MIGGIIAVTILLSYIGWIMFSFWLVGRLYYDKAYSPDAAVASLMTLAMILSPIAFAVGVLAF